MNKSNTSITIPDEIVMSTIYLIRSQKVMLDRDLADLYGVETKRLKEAVPRNIERFPEDFMFELSKSEPLIIEQLAVEPFDQVMFHGEILN